MNEKIIFTQMPSLNSSELLSIQGGRWGGWKALKASIIYGAIVGTITGVVPVDMVSATGYFYGCMWKDAL